MTLAPSKTPPTSLWQLALETQEVDGQLAIALDLATSADPEQQAEAEGLINALLSQASSNQAALHRKANSICHVHEALLAKAAHLRQIAADRIAKAEAEERAAERLLDYLTRTLTALNPGQKKFPLPEYTVASRSSEAVEVDPDLVPDSLKRFEIKVKLQAGNAETADQLVSVITETIRDLYELEPSAYEIACASAPDKTLIKATLKAGDPVAGARLDKRTNWSIK
jgi:hypothetical protein